MPKADYVDSIPVQQVVGLTIDLIHFHCIV